MSDAVGMTADERRRVLAALRAIATAARKAKPWRDDFDRAVIVIIDDLERLVKRYDL